MEIKNSEAVEMYSKVKEVLEKCSFKATVCFSIVKNKNKLKDIVATLEEARLIILENHAEKDNNGNAIIENNQYKVSDTNVLRKEIQTLFDKKVNVEFEKININDLGENEILGDYIDTLSYFFE